MDDSADEPPPGKQPGEGQGFSVPDQPIYRGTSDAQLGAQLMDIRTMSGGVHRAGQVEYKEARSRLEQSENRDRVAFGLDHRKEDRAAGTGGFFCAMGFVPFFSRAVAA